MIGLVFGLVAISCPTTTCSLVPSHLFGYSCFAARLYTIQRR